MKARYGVNSMPETGENVAADFSVSRKGQDSFTVRSQAKAATAQENDRLAREITSVAIPRREGDPVIANRDSTRAPPVSRRLPASARHSGKRAER